MQSSRAPLSLYCGHAIAGWTPRLAAALVLAMALSGIGHAAMADDPPQPWRGIVKAVHQAALSTDLVLPIELIGAREGERFKRGALLVEFDCKRQRLELNALLAVVRESQIAVSTNEHLVRRGAGNRNDVEVALARRDKAVADAGAMEQRLTGCRIVAPFDGTVLELSVNAHEMPPSNRPLMTIASDRFFEIEIVVPSRLLPDLTPKVGIHFAIDETKRGYRARIIRNAGSVDPVSQLGKVYAVFDDEVDGVLPGMSGTATLVTRQP